MIAWSQFETSFGKGTVVCRNDRIVHIVLPPRNGESLEQIVSSVVPELPIKPVQTGFASKAAAEIGRIFTGKGRSDDLIGLIEWPEVPAFTRAIMEACVAIPRGSVVSYGELAGRAGYVPSRYGRAVGQVMATNPLPLIVPCHRVVTSDYRLGNYGGGIEMKRWLLEREGGLGSIRG